MNVFLSLALAIISIQVVLFAIVYAWQGEVEFVSFILAKGSYLFMPEVFPKNDTADANLWRDILRTSSLYQLPPVEVNVVDVYIDRPDDNNSKQWLRIYNSNSTASDVPKDVLIFYFPGAWMLGGIPDTDHLIRTIAAETNFVAVSVDYRLAPEHPFPHGFNDAFNGLQWVKNNIGHYGGDPFRIVVTGESAGGNLAAAVTARNLDRDYVSFQDRASVIGLLMVYPPLAANFTTESYMKYSTYNYMLTATEMKYAWNMYGGGTDTAAGGDLDEVEDGTSTGTGSRASTVTTEKEISIRTEIDTTLTTSDPRGYTYQPILTPNHILQEFPPTVMIVAEYDVLRDDSYNFAERLHRLGIDCEVHNYNSTIHGFLGRFSHVADAAVFHACEKIIGMSIRH
eukprot:CAMPEP_0174964160 /NCGR_PEP_ID=MMETSP0004_2-20121128/5726_1 /TAXON_ID=420556 /ORGANISM="Ochromonas sp., Strain CCMP1393" /LENGTH=396 /DNA_ID=CAMNT_0016212855 /DNA_START=59 /DNA_END=1249 /DNA_ORIENTATION=-